MLPFISIRVLFFMFSVSSSRLHVVKPCLPFMYAPRTLSGHHFSISTLIPRKRNSTNTQRRERHHHYGGHPAMAAQDTDIKNTHPSALALAAASVTATASARTGT
jgi:hypothetical protein